MTNPMMALAVLGAMATAANAQSSAMTRVLSCAGPDARMEVFLPSNLLTGKGASNVRLNGTVIGRYVLDLSEAGKGKPDEEVKISWSSDRRAVVVDQFTRKLPPTRIPVGGGTVDFDKRFGTKAKCGPFNG